jgi:hypothetical protein
MKTEAIINLPYKQVITNQMPYTAKITDATKEHSLPDNKDYMDVRFDIMLDGEAVAERRLGFPLGTTEEAILAELKAYCLMFENDHALAAEAAKRSEETAEAESVLSGLKGKEVGQKDEDDE